MTAAIQGWQAELLDLSKGNPLLYLRPNRALLVAHPAIEPLFDGLVNRSRAYSVYRPEQEAESVEEELALVLSSEETGTEPDPSPPPQAPRPDEVAFRGQPKKVHASLYRYRLRARTMLVEQGVNILYMAFGLLDWAEAEGSDARILSPLVLVPVRLDQETSLSPYRLEPIDEQPVFNPALAFKMDRDFNLTLGLPASDDAEQVSLAAALDRVKRAVQDRRDWAVQTKAFLGLFSFAKQAMYADLAANLERFAAHPVIRAVAGDDTGLSDPPVAVPPIEHLDEAVAPSDVYQVLDADASQQEAIALVKAGSSLVIQGPPGTGKSQTITNIIAESLAQQKTVLFVSEKMAALNVVEHRLTRAGLRDFCLKAHSQDLDKATVVRDLARALEGPREVDWDLGASDLASLAIQKSQLNAYVRALHDRANPLGRSAFQVHGDLAQLANAPIVPFRLPEIGVLTQERLAGYLDLVRQLQSVGRILLDASSHPWAGCALTEYTPQLQTEIRSQLGRLASSASHLHSVQGELRRTWGLPQETSLHAARFVRDLLAVVDGHPRVPGHWLKLVSLEPLVTLARANKDQTDQWRTTRSQLGENATAVLALDLTSVQQGLSAGREPASRIRGTAEAEDLALLHREAIVGAVQRATSTLTSVITTGQTVADLLGLPAPTTLAQAVTLSQILEVVVSEPYPERDWFSLSRLAELDELAKRAAEHQQTVNVNRTAILEKFEDEFFTIAADELAHRFENGYGSWFSRIAQVMSYRRDLGRLKRLLRDQSRPRLSYEEALTAIRQARRAATALEALDAGRQVHVAAFGRHYAGAATDWEETSAAIARVRKLLDLLGRGSVTDRLVSVMLGENGGGAALRPYSVGLQHALDESTRAIEELAALVSLEDLSFGPFALSDVPALALADWLTAWLEGLSPFWSAADALKSAHGDHQLTAKQLLELTQRALAVQSIEREIAESSEELRQTFGDLFADLETDWDNVLNALAWATRVEDQFAGQEPTEAFIAALNNGVPVDAAARADLVNGIAEVEQLGSQLSAIFEPGALRVAGELIDRVPLASLSDWCTEHLAALGLLEEWVDFARVREAASRAGLGEFIDGLVITRPEPSTWQEAFRRQVDVLWLTWRYETAPALATFRHQRHEDLIDEFRRLDQAQWRLALRRIASRLLPLRPVVTENLHPRSEPAIILHESIKRRRFRPLRKLFADLPNLLPALKPCMLMSPLSVAQLLGESAMTFDVLVFDEASQILPADAIGAIGRAKQVVVVGDQQQLPPTRFFAAGAQFLDDGTDEEVPESILDACLGAGIPQKPLLWHYRSRHEHLIAFSNRWFYDRRLVTFPSPNDGQRAVELIHVADGVYDRASQRINRVEADGWLISSSNT